MLKKTHWQIAAFAVILVVFVVALLGMTTPTPVSAAEPTPQPCPNGQCGGNWDYTCKKDGHNFVRHDVLGPEFVIGDSFHGTVYELTWEGEVGAFDDGIVRIVAVLNKGQARFVNGYTLNGYCYTGSTQEIRAYLLSGQAGHVRGLQFCTELTADYIPVIFFDTQTGNVTYLVEGAKGPDVAEIQRHLVPNAPPAAQQPAAAEQAPAAAQPPAVQPPAAVAPAPAPAVRPATPRIAEFKLDNWLPWLIAAASSICCVVVVFIVVLVLLIRWANHRQPPAAQPPAHP